MSKTRATRTKLVRMSVPDTTSVTFKAEARRASLRIAQSPHDADDQAFIDSISEF